MLIFRRKGKERNSGITKRTALSYYRSGPPPSKSPFQKNSQRPKRRLISRTLDWLIILLVLSGVVYSLILRPEPAIILSSTAYHPTNSYKDAAAATLKSLKNRNKLTFDEASLVKVLKLQFPEINEVSANLPLFGQTATIHIEIAQPSLVLRGAEGTSTAAERFIIDAKGTVVGPQSNFPSIKELPLITDETSFEAGIGQSVLSLSDVNFILTIIAQLKTAKVPIASLTLPRLAQEIDLRTADHSYYVKFHLGGDALTQSGQFLAARRQFDQTKKQPLRYLDVRVNGKIYYQ